MIYNCEIYLFLPTCSFVEIYDFLFKTNLS
jgi:hypothetical protein